MAVTDLRTLNHALRKIVLSRWTKDEIMEFVAVRMPAPIFDQLSREVMAEVPTTEATVKIRPYAAGSYFTFEGIKYERVDGDYWSIRADTGKR